MGQDRADLGAEMASLIGEAKDTLEENKFAVGVAAGGTDPLGMLPPHGTANMFTNVDTISVDVAVAADLYKVEAALPIRFRPNAAWFMNRIAIRSFQALETVGGALFNSRGGYPAVGAVANDPFGNTGLTLLGYPVWEVPSAATDITTTDCPILAFGDPRSYCIVDRVGMSIEVIPHLFDGSTPSLPYGRRGLYAFWRNSAKPINVDGMRVLMIQ